MAWWDVSNAYPVGHVAYLAQVSGDAVLLYEYNDCGDHLLRTDRRISLTDRPHQHPPSILINRQPRR